ncbi:hypothetical protein Goklo_001332 [Gossypium klotzschianum]|uniref:Uncharacterized protein n=1 Tax=Gossypium klotzschianum TaxID=34286 RepID=A0A7J8W0M7_9ROSI|nr:hypothetical protein [Gossypium klotzschianum]
MWDMILVWAKEVQNNIQVPNYMPDMFKPTQKKEAQENEEEEGDEEMDFKEDA